MSHEGCCGSHNHGENHEGCCGHNHNEDSIGYEKITISLDGEEDVECDVLGVFEACDKEYIALLPTNDEEVLIFRYTVENENVSLDSIESDEEYDIVAQVFNEIFMEDDDDLDEEVE